MNGERRKIEELNLIDDFMFTEASTDERTANLLLRMIIERATGLKVGKIAIEIQKTVNGVDTDSHGIRLDVSVKEVEEAGEETRTIRFFDVEPNNIKRVHLPKRSRFYQALADVKLLETGVDYDKLPDMFTIWILPYDPFDMNYMLYTVKNRVEEFPEIEYTDGVTKLFLYTDGKFGGSDWLKDLLKYIENSSEENAVDDELKKLHGNVERLKGSSRIGVKYMNMQEVIKYKVLDAVEEATAKITEEVTTKVTEEVTAKVTEEVAEKTERRMAELTRILLAEKRYEDLGRMSEDKEYRKKLLEEYGI